MTTKPNPVVFIHGLWIHASAWQPWLGLFAERGYPVSAPGWPGDADTVAATRAANFVRNSPVGGTWPMWRWSGWRKRAFDDD